MKIDPVLNVKKASSAAIGYFYYYIKTKKECVGKPVHFSPNKVYCTETENPVIFLWAQVDRQQINNYNDIYLWYRRRDED